jgi:TPR repeat protein
MKSEVLSNTNNDGDGLFLAAEKYEEKNDFKSAFKCLLMGAELNHILSQISLGNFYSWGRGTAQDTERAAYWYKKAYRNGSNIGAYNLALDKKKSGNIRAAVRWFEKAIDLDYGEACTELAKIRIGQRNGRRAAVRLLRKAVSMSSSSISDDGKEEAAKLLLTLTSRSPSESGGV